MKLNLVFRIFLFVVFISISFESNFSQVRQSEPRKPSQTSTPQPKPPSLDTEANKKMNIWISGIYTKCDDGFYYLKEGSDTPVSLEPLGIKGILPLHKTIYQVKDLTSSSVKYPPSELEALNGLEWRGGVEIYTKYFRKFDLQYGWSKWENGFSVRYSLVKERGKDWQEGYSVNIDLGLATGYDFSKPRFTAPTCAEIKPYFDESYRINQREQGRKIALEQVKKDLKILTEPCDVSKPVAEQIINLPIGQYNNNPNSRIIKGFLQIKPKGKDWLQIFVRDTLADYFGGLRKKNGSFSTLEFAVSEWRFVEVNKNSNIAKSGQWQIGNPIDEIAFDYRLDFGGLEFYIVDNSNESDTSVPQAAWKNHLTSEFKREFGDDLMIVDLVNSCRNQ